MKDQLHPPGSRQHSEQPLEISMATNPTQLKPPQIAFIMKCKANIACTFQSLPCQLFLFIVQYSLIQMEYNGKMRENSMQIAKEIQAK